MKNKIIVVAAAIIKDHHLLVARRAPHLKQGGLWELPGGKVEVNETKESALVREISEELNLVPKLLGCVAESLVQVNDRWIQMSVYHCTVNDFSGIQHPDHSAIKWVNEDDLFDLDWAPADVPILGDLCKLVKK